MSCIVEFYKCDFQLLPNGVGAGGWAGTASRRVGKLHKDLTLLREVHFRKMTGEVSFQLFRPHRSSPLSRAMLTREGEIRRRGSVARTSLARSSVRLGIEYIGCVSR